MRRRRVRLFATVAAVGLLTASTGCGARWEDSQREAVDARYSSGGGGVGGGGNGNDAAGGRAGDASTGGTNTGGANTGGGTNAGGGSTGGGSSTGGGGSTNAGGGSGGGATGGGTSGGGTGGAAAGPRPCDAPSDAPGVTDDTITLGSISSLSGPVPGLGTAAQEAVRAYVAYRNATTGGVCGRELALRAVDDGTDNGRHRALVQELNDQIIALVGGVGGGDAGSADTVVQLNMPAVATVLSEQFQNAATVFDINPPFADVNAVIAKYRYLYDQGVRRASIVYLGVDQTRSEILGKQRPQMEAAGIEVVNQQELPLSTLSYDAAARAVANANPDYLLFLADFTQSAAMARAMHDTGFQPRFAEYVTAYGADFIDIAGAGAEGAISWIRNLPNEEPDSNPEQAAFLEWMAQISPDAPADTFAADAWAAAKAVVDGLEALPGPISRDALIAQLRSMNEYDAGGLIGRIQLGNKLNNGCFIAMKVVGGEWQRMYPDSGFLC